MKDRTTPGELARLAHGTRHMDRPDHLSRLGVILTGILAAVVIDHPMLAGANAALLMVAVVMILTEWRGAALDCEFYGDGCQDPDDDEGQGDEDDDFGMAA